MKINHIISIFLISILTFNNIFSQISLTPEAANLFNYRTADINESTGLVGFSLGLYTSSLDNLDMSIELQYDSRGIKVEVECGKLGISWSLFAGDVINRTKNGLPYEFTQTFSVYTSYDYPEIKICDRFVPDNCNMSCCNKSQVSNAAGNYLIQNGSLSGYNGPIYGSTYHRNPEPDIFICTL